MDKQQKELAWERFVESEPYFNPRDLYEVYKQMFMAGLEAGYEIRRVETEKSYKQPMWDGNEVFGSCN